MLTASNKELASVPSAAIAISCCHAVRHRRVKCVPDVGADPRYLRNEAKRKTIKDDSLDPDIVVRGERVDGNQLSE
jgi:hypothetical protein